MDITEEQRQIIAKGQKAELLLSIPEFNELTQYIETEIFNRFRKTNVSDIEEREKIHTAMYGIDLFRKRIEKYIESAKVEISKINNNNNLNN